MYCPNNLVPVNSLFLLQYKKFGSESTINLILKFNRFAPF